MASKRSSIILLSLTFVSKFETSCSKWKHDTLKFYWLEITCSNWLHFGINTFARHIVNVDTAKICYEAIDGELANNIRFISDLSNFCSVSHHIGFGESPQTLGRKYQM